MFTTKLEVGLALAVVVLVLLGIGDLAARHRGAQACVNADTTLANKAVATNVTAQATQHIANAAEDQTRDNTLAMPVAPTPTVPVGLQPSPVAPRCNALPAARAAPGPSAPGPDIRAAEPAVLVLEDADPFIRSDVQRARDADAEIRDRDQLLENLQAVCTARHQ